MNHVTVGGQFVTPIRFHNSDELIFLCGVNTHIYIIVKKLLASSLATLWVSQLVDRKLLCDHPSVFRPPAECRARPSTHLLK